MICSINQTKYYHFHSSEVSIDLLPLRGISELMVSIIVCTYNREKFISQCLESIATQSALQDLYELIFVDNRSTDHTADIFSEFQQRNKQLNCHYFLEEQQGLSYARNRGIRESKGDIIAFLDDDAVACEDYVANLQNIFGETSCEAGGGKILPKWEGSRPEWMGKFLLPLVSVINLGDKVKEFPRSKYPIGANMFFKRSVFDRVGDFNTQLGRTGKNMMGGEEKDIFYRVKQKGGKIYYFPDILVHHIIPKERTTLEFIKTQAIGIGASEKARTKDQSLNYLSRLILELIKWGATIFISIYYLILLKFKKAFVLLKFRYWVSYGLVAKFVK